MREVNARLNDEFKEEMATKLATIGVTLSQLQGQFNDTQLLMTQILSSVKGIEKNKGIALDPEEVSNYSIISSTITDRP